MEIKKKVAPRRLSQGGNKEGEPKERLKQKRKIGGRRRIKGSIMKEKIGEREMRYEASEKRKKKERTWKKE